MLTSYVLCMKTNRIPVCAICVASCVRGSLAHALHCVLDSSDNNRPVAGRINICPSVRYVTVIFYLIQNSQAVKKECSPQKGYGEKRREIQSGSQEMAVMVV